MIGRGVEVADGCGVEDSAGVEGGWEVAVAIGCGVEVGRGGGLGSDIIVADVANRRWIESRIPFGRGSDEEGLVAPDFRVADDGNRESLQPRTGLERPSRKRHRGGWRCPRVGRRHRRSTEGEPERRWLCQPLQKGTGEKKESVHKKSPRKSDIPRIPLALAFVTDKQASARVFVHL